MNRADFLNLLPELAKTQVDRAVLIVSFAKQFEFMPAMTCRQIATVFEEAHLAAPNVTLLAQKLTSDRRVSYRSGQARALRQADMALKSVLPEGAPIEAEASAPKLDAGLLKGTPFIDGPYLDELEKLTSFYKALHTLENSMRRLIESVLARKLGANWWDVAASTAMKRKHSDRLEKERLRSWLPARASLGPLYSIDWSDLITLIRKYESDFVIYIGEVDFMHRYADLGLVRHVIAHHGFIEGDSEIDRIALALRDWKAQVAPVVRREFGV